MRSHPGVAAKVFQTLAEEQINIEMISTSPIKISCIIRQHVVPQAVRALHDAFELGEGGIEPEEGAAMTRVAVVGATGNVGRVMLDVLRERGLAQGAGELVLFASPRLGGHSTWTVVPVHVLDDDADLSRIDVALFSAGRVDLARVGAAVRRCRRGRRGQLKRVSPRAGDPTGRLRGQPPRPERAPWHCRQPQLLDDAAAGRARPNPSRGRDRAVGRFHLPVGLGHRQGGARRARRPDDGRDARRAVARDRRSTPTTSRST